MDMGKRGRREKRGQVQETRRKTTRYVGRVQRCEDSQGLQLERRGWGANDEISLIDRASAVSGRGHHGARNGLI